MSKQILIETRQFKPNPVTITEVSGDLGGNIMVEGILATVEVKNGNGRYYKKICGNVKLIISKRKSIKNQQKLAVN